MTNTINQRIKVTKEDYLEMRPTLDANTSEVFINDFVENYESRINYDLEFAYDIATNEPMLLHSGEPYIKKPSGRLNITYKRFIEDCVSVDKNEFEQKFPGVIEEYIEQSLQKREKEAIKRKNEKELQYIQQYRQLQEARKQLQDMS